MSRQPRKARTAAQKIGATIGGPKAAKTRAKNTALMTPKQRAAEHKKLQESALKAARTRAAEVKAFQAAHHGQKPSKGQLHPRGATGLLQGTWILGANDEYDSCIATAFANSLLLATGIRVPDEEVLALYEITGLVSIKESLEALSRVGLAGVKPVDCSPVTIKENIWTPGLILGVAGDHTIVFDSDGIITWGGKISYGSWQVEEAWSIDWPVKERT
jgi:hypothetical protein